LNQRQPTNALNAIASKAAIVNRDGMRKPPLSVRTTMGISRDIRTALLN
jgi:hypothetical protein